MPFVSTVEHVFNEHAKMINALFFYEGDGETDFLQNVYIICNNKYNII